MTTPSPLAVLVVGAGPTGLTLAATLAKQGVPVRLVDRNAARTDKSKALGVQAGTLEVLGHAFSPDLPEKLVAAGRLVRSAFLHVDDRPPTTVDLSAIPSRYDGILILEQSETERMLEETLEKQGIRVERQVELTGLREEPGSITAELRSASGEVERVTAAYVVGCDGAHSTVRHQLGIPFVGSAYEGVFVLGDVAIEWPWSYDSIRTFVSRHGVMACFPMRGERRYRLLLVPKTGQKPADSPVALEELEALARTLSTPDLRVSDPRWLTRFRVHHRLTARFRQGRAFLAGDAAHIHSPAGGQGMNTGIQDALNLGHKLARVLVHGADPTVLDRYERERRPVARGVLRGTDLVFRLALLPETRVLATLRSQLFPRIVGSRAVQRRVAVAMSEVAVAREEIARLQEG